MPWKPADAKTHSKKAKTPQQQAQWAKVANSARAACMKDNGDEKSCDAKAIKQANGVIAKGMEERKMPDLREITKSVFEIAFASLTGETNTNETDRLRLLESYRDDFDQLSEAKTKTVGGKARPAGDFLVVEDPDSPSTWHLPVKVNGKPDRRLMGAAKAALGKGYRGNVYEGPDKAGATKKLKALYKAEDMPWAEVALQEFGGDMPSPHVFAPTAMTFADMAAADEANETADNVRHLSRRFQTLFDNVMFSEEVDDKVAAIRGLVDEFAMLMGETPTVETDRARIPDTVYAAYEGEWKLGDRTTIIHEGKTYKRQIVGFSDDSGFKLGEVDQLGELHADGVAIKTADATEADLSEVQVAIETGRRAPVVVDFRILKPGPGNKKHKRYYPADVLKRDIHVFNEVDVYATDHIMKERNEETKKGRVLECPAYFMKDGSPIARVLIYDPYQAEKARNRADAGALKTLECSIFGKGKATPGQVDGQNYSIVQEMTRGLYLDLVSKGGASGQAQNLVESENGGEPMETNEEKTTPDADTEVVEVDIEESAGSEAEPEADETPTMLESEAVDAALAEVKLPKFVKAMLGVGQYADTDALQEAVTDAIAEVKKMTGSGNVVGLGETEAPEAEAWTVEELAERADERYENTKRRFGM